MKWFRLYSTAIHDPKILSLPPAVRWHWIELLCLASDNNPRGVLPPTKDIAITLRVPLKKVESILAKLVEVGLVDENGGIHNWSDRQPNSDNAAERMKKHRTSSEHSPNKFALEVDTEQNRTEQKKSRPEADALLVLLTQVYHEQYAGRFTSSIADDLRYWADRIPNESDYGHQTIQYAFREAEINGRMPFSYVLRIFERLEREGWPVEFAQEPEPVEEVDESWRESEEAQRMTQEFEAERERLLQEMTARQLRVV